MIRYKKITSYVEQPKKKGGPIRRPT